MKRVHLTIAGRVQGVWYRASTVEEGQRLGLVGTARNLADGTVEVYAEGPRDVLQQLVDWCWEGPRLARVTGIDVRWGEATGGFADFRIVR